MTTAKVFYLKNKYDGLPKETDFEIREEVLPAIKDGEDIQIWGKLAKLCQGQQLEK